MRVCNSRSHCRGSWEWGSMKSLLNEGYKFIGEKPIGDNQITFIYEDKTIDIGKEVKNRIWNIGQSKWIDK